MAAAPRPKSSRKKLSPAPESIPVIRGGWPSGIALLDEDSLVRLEAVQDDPPAGSLVVVACEFSDVAYDAAEMLATGILGAASLTDLRVLSPAGERWTVAEVEALSAAVRVFPRTRHVLILTDAQNLDRRAADRLLLVLEEPPTPLLVLMLLPTAQALPATIRGRASSVVELRTLSPQARAAALVSLQVQPAVAEEAVRLAGIRPSLAGPFALDSELRSLAKRALDPALEAGGPVTSAYKRLSDITRLAVTLDALRRDTSAAVIIPSKPPSEISSGARALVRDLILVWVTHRREALRGELFTITSAEIAGVEASLLAATRLLEDQRIPLSSGLALSVAAIDSLGL